MLQGAAPRQRGGGASRNNRSHGVNSGSKSAYGDKDKVRASPQANGGSIVLMALVVAAYAGGYLHGTLRAHNYEIKSLDYSVNAAVTHAQGPGGEHSQEIRDRFMISSASKDPSPSSSSSSSSSSSKSAASILFPAASNSNNAESVVSSSASTAAAAPSLASSGRKGDGKDVVIGMAKGIAPKPLAMFLGSLREYSSCDVVLWVDSKSTQDPMVQTLLKKYEVEFKVFSPSTLKPSFMAAWHPSSYRWPLIYDFLRNDAAERNYRGVLLADIRDTAFQKDPFSILDERGAGFYASSEDRDVPKRRIQDCGWNSGWIKSCYSDATYARVSDKPISCSGMSIASLSEATEYARKMNDKLVSDSGKSCERNGVDQGMHNVLVWTDEIPNLKIITQESGPIANMQSEIPMVAGSGASLRVKNAKGGLMAIVHQYDRDLNVLRAFEEKYVYWKPDDEKLCERYKTDDSGQDLFAGRCDLGLTGGATSKGDCCRACDNWQGCKAFAFSKAAGKCFIKGCNDPSQGRNKQMPGGGTTGYLP